MRNAAAGQALPLPETLTACIRSCVENAKRSHQQHFHTRKLELGECGRLVDLGMHGRQEGLAAALRSAARSSYRSAVWADHWRRKRSASWDAESGGAV
jgi:hypothetical protein